MADEDLAPCHAFGRYGKIEDRTVGATVVRRHQHAGTGHWFLCDCLGDVPRPPALNPVTEDHVRRHTDPPWPAHDPACDFYRDQAEQRLVCGSHICPAPRKPIPLVTGRSRDRHRGRLATLLLMLLLMLEKAGLTRIGPGQPLPSIADHYRALRTAALELEEDVILASFLCTYLPALPELMAKIARTPPERFRRSHRPHVLLVTMAAEGQILPLSMQARHVEVGQENGQAARRVLDHEGRLVTVLGDDDWKVAIQQRLVKQLPDHVVVLDKQNAHQPN